MTQKIRFTDSLEDKYAFFFFKDSKNSSHISIEIRFKDRQRSIEVLGYAVAAHSFALPLVNGEISWHAYDLHDFGTHRKACMSSEAISFVEKIMNLKAFL